MKIAAPPHLIGRVAEFARLVSHKIAPDPTNAQRTFLRRWQDPTLSLFEPITKQRL